MLVTGISSFIQCPQISLFLSPISSAYYNTERTPPSLILSFIPIFLVRHDLCGSWHFSIRSTSWSWFIISIWLYMTCRMPSIHALSYILMTSRNVTYTGLFCCVAAFLVSLSTKNWFMVAWPFLPTTCASVISAFLQLCCSPYFQILSWRDWLWWLLLFAAFSLLAFSFIVWLCVL